MQQPADLDFCSITIDANMENELQQRLHTVVKQREELQHMETGIKAELIARSQIVSLHNTYESQIKEHVNANVKLQVCFMSLASLNFYAVVTYVLKISIFWCLKEQLREREQAKHELEREIENKERELHAIRLDTQAVCFLI